MLVSEYLQLWLETFVEPFRAGNTVKCYKQSISCLPNTLLSSELTALNGITIQQALNHQARTTPRAAQLSYAMLHCALGRAVLLGLIERNPTAGCIKPAHTPKAAAVFTLEEMRVYLQAIRAVDCYPLLLLMASTGIRRGEALGLMWSDINGNLLHIRRQIQYSNGQRVSCPLKSSKANRVLPLADSTRTALLAARSASSSLFICEVSPGKLRRDHLRAIALAKLRPDVTLHGLRHSMATIAAGQGVPIKILQTILGHAKYDLTADLYAAHLDTAATQLPLFGYADAVGL